MSPKDAPEVLSLTLPAIAGRALAEPLDPHVEVLEHFDRHAPRLLRYVGSFGLTGGATEEIVQDVFLSLFRHLELGRPRTNLAGWLFRVAHNLALRHRRTIARRRETPLTDAIAAECADTAEPADASIAARQRQRLLSSIVRALPLRDRQCLLLRAEGLSYRDIARTLNISVGSVAKSIARVLTRVANADR